jgi:hypothetical protein
MQMWEEEWERGGIRERLGKRRKKMPFKLVAVGKGKARN